MKASYPSCHENSVPSFIHFEELAFNISTALAHASQAFAAYKGMGD